MGSCPLIIKSDIDRKILSPCKYSKWKYYSKTCQKGDIQVFILTFRNCCKKLKLSNNQFLSLQDHYTVCVLPIDRSSLIVLLRMLSTLLIGTSCHSWFCPVLPFTIGSRSPCRNVCPSQALCLLLMVHIFDFSSSTLCLTRRCSGTFSKATFRSSLTFVYHLFSMPTTRRYIAVCSNGSLNNFFL